MKESLELFNNQAITFASHGEYPEAIACFKKALQFEQGNNLLWFNMGVTYRDAGDFDSAKSALEQALVLSQKNGETGEAEMEVLAQMLFANGNLLEAFDYCAKGVEINMHNSHLWNIMGVILFNMSEYEDAATAFEEAVSNDPYYYDALYNLRDTYSELGNEEGQRACEMTLSEISKKDL